MYKLSNWLTISLAVLLPWHGAITVFLPDEFRWWKELVLILLIGLVMLSEWRAAKRNKVFKFTEAELCALGFLIWGGILASVSGDIKSATIAMRYLGLPFLTFFIWSIWFQNPKNNRAKALELFAKGFIPSCLIATAFGIWITKLGGVDFVQNFYSTTISSWVPGQTIPLWHEINGVARLQGASSGPIEYSHLLVAALALVPLLKRKLIESSLVKLILVVGIAMSASRSAMIGAIIILGWGAWKNMPKSWPRKKISIIGIMLGLATIIGLLLGTNILQRAGTNDHFRRPYQAIIAGHENFVSGHLGQWGPASKIKNMTENNNDQGPIAENVIADWWVQLGALGMILGVAWLFYVTIGLTVEGIGFAIAAIVMLNLASIFDMTPTAIAWGTLLAMFHKDSKK